METKTVVLAHCAFCPSRLVEKEVPINEPEPMPKYYLCKLCARPPAYMRVK